MSDWAFQNAGAIWLCVAAIIAICELLIPGVYLAFLSIGAALTGILALIFPDLGIAGQMISFAAWSTVAVLIGKEWYKNTHVPTSDPDLNDRGARMVGQSARVVEAFIDGQGRVRVGDGEWPAQVAPGHMPLEIGTPVRINAVRDGIVHVSPLPQSLPASAQSDVTPS